MVAHHKPSTRLLSYPEIIEKSLATLLPMVEHHDLPARWLAIRLLEDDALARQQVTADVLQQVTQQQKIIHQALQEDADILLADSRYRAISQLLQAVCQQQTTVKQTLTDWVDRVVLNRFLGIPLFLFVMYLMFVFSVNVGGAFQDLFDIGSSTIFIQGLSQLLNHWHFSGWLVAIVAAGIGSGINTTITFVPVIAGMFLFLALLERSGYMARAAFVVDRFMQGIGLPGKSFVPMIVGFGCNVPAIMGARTLENAKDRILTVMMTPFMSCGARLAIYAVFVATFFRADGAIVRIYFIYDRYYCCGIDWLSFTVDYS